MMTTRETLLALSTNAKVSKVECVVDYSVSSTCDSLPQFYMLVASSALGFYANGRYVGSIKVTFASAAKTEWEVTRWDDWSNTCGVHLLHDNNAVWSATEGRGASTGYRETVTIAVSAGSVVELFEGATTSGSSDYKTCGAILYRVKICPTS